MSALVERIIAARDRLRGFAVPSDDDIIDARDAMADAANVIVGQEALLKAESAARLDLSLLAAEEAAKADLLRALLTRAREYVTDALEAYEHSDGRDLLKEIDAALGQVVTSPADGSQVEPSTTGAGRHIPLEPNPFIQWNGGENPLNDIWIEFMQQNGYVSRDRAGDVDWHANGLHSIIAYRIIPTDAEEEG